VCFSIELLGPHLPLEILAIWGRFVQTTRIALQSSITRDEVTQIREGYIAVVTQREQKLYHPEDPITGRANVVLCRMALHMLLHIAKEIETSGPLIGYSQYTCERLIGQMKATLHSYRFPYANLALNVFARQVKYILEMQSDAAPPAHPRASLRQRVPPAPRIFRHKRTDHYLVLNAFERQVVGPLLQPNPALLGDIHWTEVRIQRRARLEVKLI
jgi:hypothetical protein